MLRVRFVHNMSLQFDHLCCLDISELGTCLYFMCHETVIEGKQLESSFSFSSSIHQFNSMFSTHSTTFDARRTPTSVDSMSRYSMFLFFLGWWDSWASSSLWGTPLPPRALHLQRSASRHLHVALQVAQCHHNWCQILAQRCRWSQERHCSAVFGFPTSENFSQYGILFSM